MRNKDYPLYNTPVNACLAEMLRVNAEQKPDGIAVRQRAGRDVFDEITYKKIYEDVKRIAKYVSENYGTDNHIAIIGENSYEWLIAFLGVVTSGNVAVPTDKEQPAEEIKKLLASADVTAAFVSKTYSDLVENIENLKTMTLKQLRDVEVAGAESFELVKPDMEKTAAIFFTSGTTGFSKGVMLTHKNITEEINQTSQLFDPEGTMTVSVLPFNHAFGLVVAVLMALNYQVTIFITKSLKTVQEDIKSNKPSIVMLVPLFVETFYKGIIAKVREQGKEKKLNRGMKISNFLLKLGIDLRRKFFKDILEPFGGNLKWIICGGAPLDPFYIEWFRALGINLLNGYGTTECSPCIAVNRNYFYKDGSVGQMIPGAQAKVAEDGEILVKGDVVTKGYYKNPEATAEAFTEDGWYKTGDLGRVDEDRFIFLTGRKKNLIILSNGENISPEELEKDFHIDEGVKEVLVYEWENKLVAEIFPEDGYIGNAEYFNALMLKVNEGRPLSKQIASVKLREVEFIKNTTKKIVRSKNIPVK